jgi:hypothetical protein
MITLIVLAIIAALVATVVVVSLKKKNMHEETPQEQPEVSIHTPEPEYITTVDETSPPIVVLPEPEVSKVAEAKSKSAKKKAPAKKTSPKKKKADA